MKNQNDDNNVAMVFSLLTENILQSHSPLTFLNNSEVVSVLPSLSTILFQAIDSVHI